MLTFINTLLGYVSYSLEQPHIMKRKQQKIQKEGKCRNRLHQSNRHMAHGTRHNQTALLMKTAFCFVCNSLDLTSTIDMNLIKFSPLTLILSQYSERFQNQPHFHRLFFPKPVIYYSTSHKQISAKNFQFLWRFFLEFKFK